MRGFFIFLIIFGLTTIYLLDGPRRAYSQSDNTGILDGMVFIGHVGPKGSDADGEDEVVFQNGRFLSSSCSKYGFELAPYTASRNGKDIVFSAVTHSPKHGQIDWQGRVIGEEIEATYRWTKERWYWFDANEEHWLKARLKKD